MADQSNIQSAASKSIRPFRSSEEYLYAMKEDLAEWLNALYDLDVHVDIFMEALETGCALCQHANHVNQSGLEFEQRSPAAAGRVRIPRGEVTFASRNVSPGSFIARDNVSNFIDWCRRDLGIRDALMFESDDLVLRKNEKNFVLCLLEVARRGAKFGMLAPLLIQLEEEIDQEIRDAMEEPPDQEAFRPRAQRRLCDFKNLDAMVREILGHCSCPSQFPMTKVSEGKYKVGETSTLIFIRVLRNHVMVRVGGGWDTLEHYLNKHDPCRCASPSHRYQPTKPAPKSFLNSNARDSNARVSRAQSPGPYHVSESPSSLRVPENTKLMDKRTLSAAELVTVNQNGLPVTPPTRAFSPTNASSKSEMTRHQGTPANPASRAEVISKRSTQSPGPLAQGVHAGRTFLSRPRDRSEPRFSSPGRARDSLTPWRQPGDRENTSAKSGRPKTLLCAGRPATEEVLIINRTEGRHVIHRPDAPQDPTPQTVRRRRRSEPSEQSQGPGQAPSHQSPAPDCEARPAPSRVKEAQPGRVRADPSKNTKGEANKRLPKSPASSTLHPTQRESRCPAPSAGQRKARSSSPAPPTRQPASTGRRTRQTVCCLDNNRNVLKTCLDSQCHQSSAGCTPANPSPWEAGGSGELHSTHSKTERELSRSLEEELLANTKGVLSESGSGGGGEALEVFLHTNAAPPIAKAEQKLLDLADCSTTPSTSSSSLKVVSKRPGLHHLGERQSDGAEQMPPGQSCSGCNASQEECGQKGGVDGVEWNRGSPSVYATNNILKTIENVRQPMLSSPSSDNKLYTMELNHLHHDSSHTGPPEPEEDQDGVTPNEGCAEPGDCSAVDKINTLNEENEPGHGNSEGSFIETSSESSVNVQLNPHHKPAVQMRAKKGLKKPDRVPSVYKLKLRPKIRPRTDNRPEKRPSKIPTPVSGKPGLKSPRSPQSPLQDSSHSRRKLKHKIILHHEELQSSSEDLLPSPSSDEKTTPSLHRDDGSWV